MTNLVAWQKIWSLENDNKVLIVRREILIVMAFTLTIRLFQSKKIDEIILKRGKDTSWRIW